VAGEAACNGVHGANRLASNSLLDGMVFGPRVVEAVSDGRDGPRPTGAMRAVLGGTGTDGGDDGGGTGDDGVPGRRVPLAPVGPARAGGSPDPVAARTRLQRAMTAGAGVLRSAASLAAAGRVADDVLAGATGPTGTDAASLLNIATVARALALAATERRESRGAHARSDFPDTDPAQRVRLVVTAAAT
jgi:L-aspartate oxidase